MFVDSDVIIPKGYFERVLEKINEPNRIGAVGGIAYPTDPMLRKLVKVSNIPIIPRTPRPHIDGNNVLIRTSCVSGISIPEDLHVAEDGYIQQFIERKGYRVIVDRSLYVFHCRPFRPISLQDLIEVTKLQRKYRLFGSMEFRTMERVVSHLIRSLICIIMFRDFKVSFEFLKYVIFSLIAYTKVKKAMR